MNKKVLVFAIACSLFFLCVAAYAQDRVQGQALGTPIGINTALESPLSFHVQPEFAMPISDSENWFAAGGALSLGGEYAFKGNPQPFLCGEVNYAYLPVKDESSSVSIVAPRVGTGINFWLTPRIALRLSGLGGVYAGFLNDGGESSSQFSLATGVQLQYMLSPEVNLSLGVSYRDELGTFQGLSIAASTAYFVRGAESRYRSIRKASRSKVNLLDGARTPDPGRGIDISRLQIDEIYPVFHKFYDEHPVGSIELQNLEPETIQDIKLRFFIKQYMDSPKECSAPAKLGPGETERVDMMALLTDRVLEVTEATKIAADLTLEYQMDGDLYRDALTVTLRLLDRNAMCWDDDRRAAAFVTAKDPAVLSFSKAVAGMVRSEAPAALNPNLMTAMGMYAAMDAYGISYVVDPQTPFVEFSNNATMIDYLQFPRQTLAYKSGDCDDLTILFAALLESVAIETALVTIPGHILLALDTGLAPVEAAREFGGADNLIVHAGKAWIPLETTLCGKGLLEAWNAGSRQWREAFSQGNAGFYPVHEAWQKYEPVGLPASGERLSVPGISVIAEKLRREMNLYIDREIAPRIAQLDQKKQSYGESPALENKLGILYARYGRYKKAEGCFLRACAQDNYQPALINLGNLCKLRDEHDQALQYFEQAARLSPRDVHILSHLMRMYHESGKADKARTTYEKIARLDRDVAERYAYINEGEDIGRAAATSTRKPVLWME